MALKPYRSKKEGIGSFFHEIDKEDFNFNRIDIPFEYKLFYTGRHAIKYLLNSICNENTVEKIWLPHYYCQHVTEWLKKSFNNLYFYHISPYKFNNSIDINSFASVNDVVIINNYWGLSDSVNNADTHPIVIEDHSHGWLTKNALNSKADYCFASLRKSLPTPLGGIAWVPDGKIKNHPQLFVKDNSFYNTWDTIAQAMKQKAQYINNIGGIEKKDYLVTISKTEIYLHNHTNLVEIRKKDYDLINDYLNINFIEKKEINLNFIYKKLKEVEFMKIIKRENHTTFGLCLLFKNEAYWNALRKYLINLDIYPSHLWPNNKQTYGWNYFLNIHIDFRYDENDLIYIAEGINNYIKSIEVNQF